MTPKITKFCIYWCNLIFTPKLEIITNFVNALLHYPAAILFQKGGNPFGQR